MARLLGASFCTCREVPVRSKNWKFSKKNIAIYFEHIYHAERVLGYVFLPKIPIFSNLPRGSEGIHELETPAVIDAINTGSKPHSTCPHQPPVILEFAITNDNEQGLNKTLGWYK
jgi:hypothetical protein